MRAGVPHRLANGMLRCPRQALRRAPLLRHDDRHRRLHLQQRRPRHLLHHRRAADKAHQQGPHLPQRLPQLLGEPAAADRLRPEREARRRRQEPRQLLHHHTRRDAAVPLHQGRCRGTRQHATADQRAQAEHLAPRGHRARQPRVGQPSQRRPVPLQPDGSPLLQRRWAPQRIRRAPQLLDGRSGASGQECHRRLHRRATRLTPNS